MLEINALDLEGQLCLYDYITVYDGSSGEHPILLRACDRMDTVTTIISSTSSLFVEFVSDAQQEYTGFNLHYESKSIHYGQGATYSRLGCHLIHNTFTMLTCVVGLSILNYLYKLLTVEGACTLQSQTLTETHGVIRSPILTGSNLYPSYSNCVWHLQASLGMVRLG